MTEQNTRIARRFIDAFAAGDRAVLEELLAENVVDHNAPPTQKRGREGLLEAAAQFKSALPDMRITVEQHVAEGDRVALFGKISGVNSGEMMGIPATGKPATFAYMDLYRIERDQIVELWHVEDIAGMLQQLGLMPG